MRFWGSEAGRAHRGWYAATASYYEKLYRRGRDAEAAAFLHALFRRHGGVRRVLDVACGTFAIGIGLLRRGYDVTGRDLTAAMLRVARRNLREAKLRARLAQRDMRDLRPGREFDALLCIGTAFNYLTPKADVRRALRAFHDQVRKGGLLVLDLTNFAAFLDNPMNVRAEVDYRAPDGTRVAVFGFNEQNAARTIHVARFLTVIQRGKRLDIRFDEAPLRIWTKGSLARALATHGFRAVRWWGDLRAAAPYVPAKSARLVVAAVRE